MQMTVRKLIFWLWWCNDEKELIFCLCMNETVLWLVVSLKSRTPANSAIWEASRIFKRWSLLEEIEDKVRAWDYIVTLHCFLSVYWVLIHSSLVSVQHRVLLILSAILWVLCCCCLLLLFCFAVLFCFVF